MSVPRVSTGDPLAAAAQNVLIDAVNRLADQATLDGGHPLLGLFQLSQALSYPAQEGQAPYADNAKALWLSHSDSTYGGTGNSPAERLYHPLAQRDNDGKFIKLPRFRAGQWVFAKWNRQGGRWEIVGLANQTSYRGKLIDTLHPAGAARVGIWIVNSGGTDADSGIVVTAHDWFLKTGQDIIAGLKVKVEWFPDDGRWYVTNAECP